MNAMTVALRTLLERVLMDPGTIEAALAEVELLAPVGGSGRVYLVVDLKDGRRAWAQSHAIQTFRSQGEIVRRSFDLIESAP